MARWPRYWLKLAEPHLRPSTLHGYRDHIDRYLIPSLGRITLADLTGRRLQACFDRLDRQRTKAGTLIAASIVDQRRVRRARRWCPALDSAVSPYEGAVRAWIAAGAQAHSVASVASASAAVDSPPFPYRRLGICRSADTYTCDVPPVDL